MNCSEFQPNLSSGANEWSFDWPLIYTVLECIVAIGAFVGNLLVVIVFIQDKRLRKVTNFYIISLAIADLLVGLIGIPSAILTRMGIPKNFLLCKTMLSLLLVLCTVSILNLLAVSLDRYWAILHPLDYHRRISEKTAMIIIMLCWIVGSLIGFLPLFGWNNGRECAKFGCLFIPVISYEFLVFLYFATIVLPALMMAFFYGRIYLVVMKQLSYKKVLQVSGVHYSQRSGTRSGTSSRQCSERRRQRFEANSLESINSPSDNSGVSPVLPKSRSLTTLKNNTCNQCIVKPIKLSYSKREVKKAQKLFIIVVFFMLCWIPLYTHNTIEAFCPDCKYNTPRMLLDFLIILSHLNSVGSPFLYAFHMKDFREALRRLLCKCAIRQRHFRDLRRQELFSISGFPNNRRTANNTLNNSLNNSFELYENTPEITPELSPNQSYNKISTFN